MTDLERELYWEMVRTIKLLGAKTDIVSFLKTMDSPMPQNEAVEETFRLVKYWNDNTEKGKADISEGSFKKVFL